MTKTRSGFLERLGQIVIEGKCAVYAWALRSNDVQILFRSGKHNISVVMQKLLTGMPSTITADNNLAVISLLRIGTNPFFARKTTTSWRLVRYIHLNPTRAGSVNTVEDRKATGGLATGRS